MKDDLATALAEVVYGERLFVQVDTNAPVMIERSSHNVNLHVRGRRKRNTTEKHNCFSRPLHGFTLVELWVVIAILGILVAMLLRRVETKHR